MPQSPPPAASTLVPNVPAGPPKLSIGKPQAGVTGAAHPAQKFIPALKMQPAVPQKKSALPKILIGAAVVIALGVGGYFGYGYWQEKKNAKAAEAAKPADPGPGDPKSRGGQDTAGADGAASAPEKKLPIIPPVWTLDVAQAKIPEAQANGAIAGTNFVVETARIERTATAQVLRLSQGAGPSPDREFLIYLHLGAGESLTGHTWTVSQDMKGSTAPQILKRWKTDPRFAPQSKFFSTGYALKLELGQSADGNIPGKIYLAVPDAEQSVVAGLFRITPATADAAAQTATQPVVSPVDPAAGQNAADRSAFEKRYGVKRR